MEDSVKTTDIQPSTIQNSVVPAKKVVKKKTAPKDISKVIDAVAEEQAPVLTADQAAKARRIAEWNKRKEEGKVEMRVRFRDYETPNIIRTIQWQAYKDWPVKQWKVRDGDIITMDKATIKQLTKRAKKKVLEQFNDEDFMRARPNQIPQTRYIEKTIQLYGFESMEFDGDMDLMPAPQIYRTRSEIIMAT